MLFVVLYVICSVLAWGFTLGSFTKEFSYMNHIGVSFVMALMGPFGLLSSIVGPLVESNTITFRLVPFSKQKRWEIFCQTYPSLCAGPEGKRMFES